MTIRVLIADDEGLVRAGLRMIVEAQPDMEVVGEATNGVDAVEIATTAVPDVVLMDIRMPRMNGIEATRRLAGRRVDACSRVLVLTTFGLDEYVYEALRAGAAGFLLKEAPPSDLVGGIRVVAGGDALLAPSITRRLIEQFVDRSPEPVPRASLGGVATLTARELDVLRMVARGLSNAQIAEALWLSEHTVKTHVAHLLTKLRLQNRVQIAVLAYESGLVVPGTAQ
jgi:DNA-binding NarL/FixJ family response regulator